MSPVATGALMAAAALAAYLWGRRGRPIALSPVPGEALADLERRLAMVEQATAAADARAPAPTATPAPSVTSAPAAAASDARHGTVAGLAVVVPGADGPVADVIDHRAAARRRDKHRARRHYEALAREVARERRRLESEPAVVAGAPAGSEVVRLPAGYGWADRVRRRYRADQVGLGNSLT